MNFGPRPLLRGAFMHAEAMFNRAFGDKLNPLYHLGALTFYLFWIVAGSGLYLYAFFDTSVQGAYRSVEALTHGQWFAGGILRSVHGEKLRFTLPPAVVNEFLRPVELRHGTDAPGAFIKPGVDDPAPVQIRLPGDLTVELHPKGNFIRSRQPGDVARITSE